MSPELAEKVFTYIKDPEQNAALLDKPVIETLKKAKLSGLCQNQLSNDFKRQWLLNQAYLDELKELKIPCQAVLLKGIHLISENIYPHLGMRFMGDVDILINKGDLDLCDFIFKKHGYRDITKGTWEANKFKKVYLKESHGLELVIELHTRLFYQEERGFKWESKPHPEFPDFELLTPEDLFIHLCGHLAYQHTFISLHWLYDIFLVVKHYQIDWEKVELRARQVHVLRSCQLILLLLKNYFGLKDLPDLGIPMPLSDFGTKLISKKFLSDPHSFPKRYWLIKHLTKDHMKDALIYDFNWLKAKLKNGKK